MAPELPAPSSSPRPRGFPGLRMLLAFVAGFGLPVLACYGLILTTGLAMQIASWGNRPSGFDLPASSAGSGPAIAVIRVEGMIASGESDPFSTASVAAADTIADDLAQARDDPDVKAILLAVNSPGGGVVASDQIYHALTGVGKPIVVIMGDMAASGGYYVSVAADWIVANPSSLTGSIGVISEFPNAQGLLEKVGVDFVVITSGPRKDFGSPYREMTEAERAYWQTIVDEIYENFVGIVAEGRSMPVEAVRPLADGAVYSGRQALELGLIDELGYESDAIRKAAELGGIEGEPRLIEYPHRPSLLQLLTQSVSRPALFPSLAEVMTQVGQPSLSLRWIGP